MKKVLIIVLCCVVLSGIASVVVRALFPKTLISKNTTLQLDHIVVIVMENKSSDEILANHTAPFFNSLMHTYSFADHYFAVSHPSLPNYLALIGGSTFGITQDCTDCYVSSTNLIDQLETVHKTWKAYMESMPDTCFVGNSNLYVQKHNPFIYFNDIRNNPNRCQHIVPFMQVSSDIQSTKSTPNFIWISPNMCHDMHDCSIATGDTWLSEQVPLLLHSPAFTQQKSLLVITWDEGENSGDNRVPTIFIGSGIKQGFVSHVDYTHYSFLHTIEYIWHMPSLTTNTRDSNLILDVFK